MEHTPIEKISVFDICEACEMNRKSFYYHFRDKYDLVNWISDFEFFRTPEIADVNSPLDYIERLCVYLYANRSFYNRAFKIKGTNSFCEHFREQLSPVIAELISDNGDDMSDFRLDFYLDAYCGAFERWMRTKDCDDDVSFFQNLKNCFPLK